MGVTSDLHICRMQRSELPLPNGLASRIIAGASVIAACRSDACLDAEPWRVLPLTRDPATGEVRVVEALRYGQLRCPRCNSSTGLAPHALVLTACRAKSVAMQRHVEQVEFYSVGVADENAGSCLVLTMGTPGARPTVGSAGLGDLSQQQLHLPDGFRLEVHPLSTGSRCCVA